MQPKIGDELRGGMGNLVGLTYAGKLELLVF